jgi:2Fe-2S ferredoxin
MKEKNISINIEHDGIVKKYRVHANEYRSLMHLIIDTIYTEGFGDCGGMGRCGTCTVESLTITEPALLQRNEASTLQRLHIDAGTYRLACQINIDEELDGCGFRIVQ